MKFTLLRVTRIAVPNNWMLSRVQPIHRAILDVCKEIDSSPKPLNRILAGKPTCVRIVVSGTVVIQIGFIVPLPTGVPEGVGESAGRGGRVSEGVVGVGRG